MKKFFGMVCVLALSCAHTGEDALRPFIAAHVAQVQPLQKEANLAYWQAACSGDSAAYSRYAALNLQLRRIYSDRQAFEFLTRLQKNGGITDPLQARQLQLLVNAYMENQIDPELLKRMVERAAEVEQTFSTFRGQIDGAAVSAGRIDEIFKNEVDAGKRRSAWEASKQVGGRIAQDLLELVRLRNQAARSLGFKDYHALSLHLAEQSQEEVERVFAELFELSQAPFIRLRRQMDEKLADKFHIAISGLAPWHYQDPFFQEAPADGSFDPDLYYAGQDVKQLAMRFYSGIGLDVTDILANSDLYERDGKNPHAFSTDIDRCGDVRILCNLQNNERWMETLLHELGHATYDRYHDQSLPYLLRQPAHAFTTEAIAMFFGRFSRQPEWMRDMLNLPPAEYEKIKEASASSMAAKQLIFARWTMVMYYFEKELYADPDQDLNRLWWRLVEKYQMIHPPLDRHEPDWAAKIHFTIAPCYYHNYLLGELFASQLTDYVKNTLPAPAGGAWSAVGCTALGDTLRNRIFKPASRYRWDEMITRATGQPLSARCFVRQFITQ